MKTKKTKVFRSALEIVIVIISGGIAAAVELEKPTANLTERFVTYSGWASNFSPNAISASGGWSNGFMAGKFNGVPVLSMPEPQKVSLVALTNSSDGRFSGDFSRIDEVSFQIQVQNEASLCFFFKSSRGVKWCRNIADLPSNTASGKWFSVSIPLALGENWYSFIETEGPIPDFSADKATVVQFGFEVGRNIGTTCNLNNLVNVDNVKLVGPWDAVTNWVNGLVPLAWLMENDLTENDLTADKDGDGYKNISEFLAGTDVGDSNSFFKVEIARNSEGKTVVKWIGNKYKSYDLLHASDLSGNFTPVATGVLGVGSEHEVAVDESIPGAHFFKLNVKPIQ